MKGSAKIREIPQESVRFHKNLQDSEEIQKIPKIFKGRTLKDSEQFKKYILTFEDAVQLYRKGIH